MMASLSCEQLHVGPRRRSPSPSFRTAFAPVLQRDEGKGGVVAAPEKLNPWIATMRSTRLLLQKIVFDLLDDGTVRLALASGGRLHVDEQEALIFIRQEGRSAVEKDPAKADEQRQIDHHEPAGTADHAGRQMPR